MSVSNMVMSRFRTSSSRVPSILSNYAHGYMTTTTIPNHCRSAIPATNYYPLIHRYQSPSFRTASQLSTTQTPLKTKGPLKPPDEVTIELAFQVQETTKMYVTSGLCHQNLKALSEEAGDVDTLVVRWRRMMESFLGTQVHVIAGLGYSVDDRGLALYNQHLSVLMQKAKPSDLDNLRIKGRDIWRDVLTTAFNITHNDIQQNEREIVDARNVMHKVSQKMIDPSVIDIVVQACLKLNKNDGNEATSMARRHEVVQETLIHSVYLDEDPTLVSECGFGEGEEAYILMQSVMAEHQNDPLIAQYIGSSMMTLLQAAGIDMEKIQKDLPVRDVV